MNKTRRNFTYVLEGLTSSTFLWNGCCVGVAAETETVDELCPSGQHAGRSIAGSVTRTMMKQKLYHLIRRPSGKNESCPTAVECRGHAQSLRAVGAERVDGRSFVKRNSSSLPSGAWQNLALPKRSWHVHQLAPSSGRDRAAYKINLYVITTLAFSYIFIPSLLHTSYSMR